VVGWTDFDAADAVARIDALRAQQMLVGLRPMVQDIADDDWLPRPALAPLLSAMARGGLVFDLAGGYAPWHAATETLLADLSPHEQADIFGGTAARIYLSSPGRTLS
jgi:predicted TIM-barrel fold metal-dependent hydrolase